MACGGGEDKSCTHSCISHSSHSSSNLLCHSLAVNDAGWGWWWRSSPAAAVPNYKQQQQFLFLQQGIFLTCSLCWPFHPHHWCVLVEGALCAQGEGVDCSMHALDCSCFHLPQCFLTRICWQRFLCPVCHLDISGHCILLLLWCPLYPWCHGARIRPCWTH